MHYFGLLQLANAVIGADISDYRYGTGVIHYRDFYCNGNEPNITTCSHSLAGTACSHTSDVGVFCLGIMVNVNHCHLYMYMLAILFLVTLQFCKVL